MEVPESPSPVDTLNAVKMYSKQTRSDCNLEFVVVETAGLDYAAVLQN